MTFCAVIAICFTAQAQGIVAPGNFHVIVPGRVYRGARPTTEAEVEWLHKLGVRTIIDLQGDDPLPFWILEHGEWPAVRAREKKWAEKYNHILWINEPMSSVAPSFERSRIRTVISLSAATKPIPPPITPAPRTAKC